MILVSAGMQRSGSRWYYNLTNDLAIAAGHPNAKEIREKYQLHEILNSPNCNVKRMSRANLERLVKLSEEAGFFTVKTHRRPSMALRRLLREGKAKATYICRDLRDVIVSGLDEGKRMREDGKAIRFMRIWPYRSFARLYTVRGATYWATMQLIPRWRAWTTCPGVLCTRYEDLKADTAGQLRRLADFMDFDVTDAQIEEIVGRYEAEKARRGEIEKPRFLVKGVRGRYKEALTPEQQALCNRRLEPYLREMGYLEEAGA